MERRFNWRWVLGLAVLVSLALFAMSLAAASAQGPTPDPDLVNHMDRIARDLYCPVCAGTPLNVCETQACEQWRNLIIEKIQAGESDQAIRQYFIDQYGDRVLGAPPPQGFNLGAYVMPFLIILAGLGVLYLTLRTWLRRAPAPAAAAAAAPNVPGISPEYAERIAKELERD